MPDMTQLLDSASNAVGVGAAAAGQSAVRQADLGKGRIADLSKGKIALLFIVLLAIVSIPILLNPLPPISDYINHLARMHIIATINTDPDLHRYYEVDWQLIPNLMMDLIVPLFVRVMNVYLAGQVYTLMSFVLIVSGTMALHRQFFGRWSALPLIAFPLLYNDVFLVGTMNYVFGIGLMLWALAAWVALRERSLALRLSVSTLFVLGLFFCHLFVLGVYGLGLLAFESHRLVTRFMATRRSSGRDAALQALPWLVIDFAATGVPFLAVPAMLMMSPTKGLWDFYWRMEGKGNGLLFVIKAYSDVIAFAFAAIMLGAMGWAFRKRALSFNTVGFAVLAVGAIFYLALPRVMFETYMVDLRLPISIAFILIACIDIDFRSRFAQVGFAVGLLLLAVVRVAEVEVTWAPLSAGVESFRKSVEMLNRGSKVAVAYADPNGGDFLSDYGLVHADCIAIIERSALVTTEFTVEGKQILHARPAYRSRVDTEDGTPPMIGTLVRVADRPDDSDDESANESNEYWRRWTRDYDYLYVLFTTPNFANPDPAHLTELYAGNRFILYRVERSQITANSRDVR
jgi:hypothetical protein